VPSPSRALNGSGQIDDPEYQQGGPNENAYAATNYCIPSRVVRDVPALTPGSSLACYHGSRPSDQGDAASNDKEPVLAPHKTVRAHCGHFPGKVIAAYL
jgi:hypothetical protein